METLDEDVLFLFLFKLRYQKCLDAHPQGFRNASSLNTPSGRGLGATLKSLVGSLTGRRNKQGESWDEALSLQVNYFRIIKMS